MPPPRAAGSGVRARLDLGGQVLLAPAVLVTDPRQRERPAVKSDQARFARHLRELRSEG